MNKSKKAEIREELVMPRCPFCGQAIIADRELVDKKDAEHYAIMLCNHADMITVRMTEEEYERFLAFRGAEKYAQSVRAQMTIQQRQAQALAENVLQGLDERIMTEEVSIADATAARKAIAAACEIVR